LILQVHVELIKKISFCILFPKFIYGLRILNKSLVILKWNVDVPVHKSHRPRLAHREWRLMPRKLVSLLCRGIQLCSSILPVSVSH
jgi:hypothetical protein